MSYANKKFIFNWLISSSFLLAGLGPVHGAKVAINVLLNDGTRIRVMPKRAIINPHLDEDEDENVIELKNVTHIPIGSTHIVIDRSKPFRRLIRSLRATSGIQRANLVMISSDERCANKIKKFNTTIHLGLSFSEQIELRRKLCSSLLKYQKQDSSLAKENLPIEQYQLACALANSAEQSEKEISFLSEAVKLLTQSAAADFQQAQEILPIVENNLGVALANSALGSGKEVSFLGEAVDVLRQSANAGYPLAKKNLSIAQNNLGVILASSAEEISILKGAVELLTQSADAGYSLAKENLPIAQYKLGCALANSTEGSEKEIPLLEEAMGLLANSVITGYHLAGETLSVVECKLSWARANSAQGLEDEVPLLREARYLLESRASSGFQHAESQDILETLEKINQRLKILTAETI
jgi:TPR repeat protein